MARKAPTVRLSRAEAIARDDMRVRGECLSMAFQLGKPNPRDTVHAADMFYDWLKSRKMPPEPTLEDALTATGRAELARTGKPPLTCV